MATSGRPLAQPEAGSTPDTRLYGSRLVLARGIWATLTLLSLTLFALMLPAYFAQLQTVCIGSVCATGQPTLDTIQVLQAHGLTLVNNAVFTIGITVVVAFVCFAVAAIIFWRRSDDWMALLFSFGLVLAGTATTTYIVQQSHFAWRLPAFILNTLTFGVIFLCFSLFPGGCFVPRWTRWLSILWIGWVIVFVAISGFFFSLVLHTLIWLCFCVCCMVAQVYRYRRLSSLVQRQQSKWIVYGVFVTIMTVVVLRVPTLVPMLGPGSFFDLVDWSGSILALIPLPLAAGMAILRSRLWDIDIIINRTLVYSILMTVLAIVYAGLVVLLLQLFQLLMGQNSTLAIVGSTFAIVVLFQPLRKCIQTLIDRRFYRHKYLAEQTLQAFGSTLRNEVDLDQLKGGLIEVICETMQPTHVSLWLCETEAKSETSRYTRVLRME